jgi:hypothetical protein
MLRGKDDGKKRIEISEPMHFVHKVRASADRAGVGVCVCMCVFSSGSVPAKQPLVALLLIFGGPVHQVHVGWDTDKQSFTGLPDEWKRLLDNSGISAKEQAKNPQAVIDVLEFITSTNKPEVDGDGDGDNAPSLTGPKYMRFSQEGSLGRARPRLVVSSISLRHLQHKLLLSRR